MLFKVCKILEYLNPRQCDSASLMAIAGGCIVNLVISYFQISSLHVPYLLTAWSHPLIVIQVSSVTIEPSISLVK